MVSRETLISEYFPERGQEALRYGEILGSWGIERGLIGPREGERIWDRHITNCLPLTKLLPRGVSLIDIGSGAGLPGIVSWSASNRTSDRRTCRRVLRPSRSAEP